ncbi:alpha/beta hydrolase-fold protein [Spirosoma pomorum]
MILVAAFCGRAQAQQQSLSQKKTVVLRATSEDTDHQLYIQLPVDYGKINLTYPVVVLLDAQDVSLFDYTSTTLDRLMGTNDIPNAIFVGIVQKDRSQELSVERNDSLSKKFLHFIENDLVRHLKQTYSIDDHFTFIGHSLGGQFVTNAMMVLPHLFRSVISISGALNYPTGDKEYSFYQKRVLTRLAQYTTNTSAIKQKYYFCVGNEGIQDEMFRVGALMADSLLQRKKLTNFVWRFDEFNQFNHMTTPLAGIPAGLVFVFHDWHFSERSAMDILVSQKVDPISALQQQQAQIRQSYGADIALPSFIYYQFTQYYQSKNELEKAKWLVAQLISRSPNDDKPLEMMANIIVKQGDKDTGLLYLKKAYKVSNKEKYVYRIRELENSSGK